MVFVFDEWSWIKRLSVPGVQQRHLGSCTENMSRWAKTLGNLKCAHHNAIIPELNDAADRKGGWKGFPVHFQTAVVGSRFSKHLQQSGGETRPRQTMDVLSVYQLPQRKGKKDEEYAHLVFFNIPKLTLTTARGQVNACEPDYPVHPAPPWGFQHFLS